ncbi:MAG: NAD(P)/FAD-dependent oxidoreductase [Candidatus Hodarchaeota archaeon]
MLQDSDHYETIIIGGGPAGIAAALHLGFHGRKIALVDRKTSPMFFATTPIHNYPGVKPLLSARAIHQKMAKELKEFPIDQIYANVVDIKGRFPQFKVELQTPKTQTRTLLTKTLIFATGIARKHPKVNGKWQKWLPYAAKQGISYYCPDCDSPLTAGKDVIIVNAGTVNSALHVARCIQPYASRIRIFMTEDAYVPFTEEAVTILEQSGFEWTSGVLDDVVIKQPGKRQSLITTDGRNLECHLFFVSWVGLPRSELATCLGVETDAQGNIVTDYRGATNVEGVWAAGDVRPITQSVATAVGTGVYAGIMATHFLLQQFTEQSE